MDSSYWISEEITISEKQCNSVAELLLNVHVWGGHWGTKVQFRSWYRAPNIDLLHACLFLCTHAHETTLMKRRGAEIIGFCLPRYLTATNNEMQLGQLCKDPMTSSKSQILVGFFDYGSLDGAWAVGVRCLAVQNQTETYQESQLLTRIPLQYRGDFLLSVLRSTLRV